MFRRNFCLALTVLLASFPVWAAESAELTPVGVAVVDITPDHPVRLQGFGGRRTESEGVDQKIYAKALAIGEGNDAVVIVTADQCIVAKQQVEEIAAKLKEKAGLSRERFVLAISHSHTTPMLTNAAPTLFGVPIPPEHQANIDKYTRFFVDKIVEVAAAALADRKPATLEWTTGEVKFAYNRRGAAQYFDHDLPVLVVKSPEGKVRVVYVTYACHCVTLGHNKVTGDWAGYAQRRIEEKFPGAVAMTSIGGGADQNPTSNVTDSLAKADDQGVQIASEVTRLLGMETTPIHGKVSPKFQRITLPFDTHPTREQWEERAKRTDAVGHHAKTQLAKLDRGEKLLDHVDYPVQTLAFGKDLAMVFLGGELVVDYSLRLKKELDASRVWVHGYSNDVPGYIPSERILREGGYEGGDAMVYYDLPTRYAAGIEEKIISTVKSQLGDSFNAPKTSRTDGTRPLTPVEGLRSLRVKQGFRVELVAAEPLVDSPVAIDWAPDGSLFVAEMRDYPKGLDGNFKPGGTVRRLTDTNGDGKYDKATVFLDNAPFPTGVTAYRKGVLVCAAPDIIYAQDTDGDGKADIRKTLYTGFATHNYQARINAIRLGLDNWWYVSAGIFSGNVESFSGKKADVSGRDFRIKPDTGEIEAVSGQSQQSRVRNDSGDWFGCDSGTLLRHYPLEDRYLARNPHFAPPSPAVGLSNSGPIHAITRKLQLFKLSGDGRLPTAACGVEIYRDRLLGDEYYGDSFTCEPVYNAVVHLDVRPAGVSFESGRAADEKGREFLASTDSWFRPVEVRTGPDGALYVVDMYRFVIEHPQWIPPERLAEVDTRAGAGMGRIYRVVKAGAVPRALVPLDKLDSPSLAKELANPSGTRRDIAHAALLWKDDKASVELVSKFTEEKDWAVRVQSLAALDAVGGLDEKLLNAALGDEHPQVRRHAVRLGEGKPFNEKLLALAADKDARVRLQLACTLGEFDDSRIGDALAGMLLADDDAYITAAVMSSAPKHLGAMIAAVLQARASKRQLRVIETLTVQAVAHGDNGALKQLVERISATQNFSALAAMQAVVRSKGQNWDRFRENADDELKAAMDGLKPLFESARKTVADGGAPLESRRQAVALLGADDLQTLVGLLSPQTPPELQQNAVEAISATGDKRVPELVLAGWAGHGPKLRGMVLDAMLGRPEWTQELLSVIEKDTTLRAALDPTRRAVLLNHSSKSISQKAGKLLASETSSARQEVIEKYANAIKTPGDAKRGAEVFTQACSACHLLNGVGKAIGPDLAGLSDVSTPNILMQVLDPNRALMDQYTMYVVTTKDGRAAAGIITAETASSITIQPPDGVPQTVLRADIVSQTSTGRSLMPEGLEAAINPAQMADLIAYLGGGTGGPYTYAGSVKPDRQYPDTGGKLLSNGKAGSDRFDDGQWVGFLNSSNKPGLQIAFDTGAPQKVDALQIVYGVNHTPGGIHAPARVVAAFSEDGLTYSPARQFTAFDDAPDGLGSYGISRRSVTIKISQNNVRYVRLDFEGRGEWTFLSEIKINPAPADGEQETKPVSAAQPEAKPLSPAEKIADLATKFTPGTSQEYQYIPQIWSIAITEAKANNEATIRAILEVALPADSQPLLHWQAVVVGGGVINGVSMVGVMPAERIEKIIGDNAGLKRRWSRAIGLASAMTDDEKVPAGTRYDAMRMLGMQPWKKTGKQIVKYLQKGVNDELRMGAWSSLSDMPEPQAAAALLDAMGEGRLAAGELADYQKKRLTAHPDEAVRTRAAKLLLK